MSARSSPPEGQKGRRALLAIAVAAVLSLFCAPAAQAEFGLITKWGLQGHSAIDVAVDAADNVYVSEDTLIQKFTSDGTLITQWGSEGTGDGQFDGASGIATDPAGNVYVAEFWGNRIQKFSSDGTFITKWGSEGGGDGRFDSPMGVATDSFGNVYVADSTNDRIQKFTSDGTFITKWGSKGHGVGQFNDPGDVATDAFGNVYVAEFYTNRIQKFTSDGTFITKWRPQLNTSAVATDSFGNVYVAEENIESRISKFTSDGAFLFEWGCRGADDGHFNFLKGIATDSAGNVYVADAGPIKKFGDPGSPTRPCIDFEAKSRQKMTELAVKITCTDQPCNVVVDGRATAVLYRVGTVAGRFQLKPVRASLARGETKTLRLRFGRQDARTLTRLLAHRHFARVKVRAKASTVGVRPSTKEEVEFAIPRAVGQRRGPSKLARLPSLQPHPQPPADKRKETFVDEYCSRRDDFCLGVSKLRGRIKLSIWTFRFRGGYELCVNGPGNEVCKGFGLQPLQPRQSRAGRSGRAAHGGRSPIASTGLAISPIRGRGATGSAGTRLVVIRSAKPCGSLLAPEPLLSDGFGADLTASKCWSRLVPRPASLPRRVDPEMAEARLGTRLPISRGDWI